VARFNLDGLSINSTQTLDGFNILDLGDETFNDYKELLTLLTLSR
jgi:hypothetical protein